MKILVGVKRVVDCSVRIRAKPDGSGVSLDGVKISINRFDEIALEEAVRIKEEGGAQEIVAISIGPEGAQQQLRTALAMGADRAVHVVTDAIIEPMVAARVFLRLVEREPPLMLLLGKQVIDDGNNQTGQMLAALWNRPQATFASKIELAGNVATVTREIDAGLEILEVDLPAVFTADLRLNEPQGLFAMSRVLIVAKHDGFDLNAATAKCVTCAAGLPGAEITTAVCAADPAAVSAQAAQLEGVASVLQLQSPANEHALAAVIAPLIVAISAGYSHVFACGRPATKAPLDHR